jgi:hypothetical protein
MYVRQCIRSWYIQQNKDQIRWGEEETFTEGVSNLYAAASDVAGL